MENKKLCNTSISLLRTRIEDTLTISAGSIWSDFPENQEISHNASDHYFFGNFFEDALKLKIENVEYRKIYVLCSGAKRILVEMLKYEKEKIEVIDRYRLFPLQKPHKQLEVQTINFYYAGRLSSAKNIDALVLSYYEYQLIYPDSKLIIYGSYDNEGNYLEHSPTKDYEKYIKSIIDARNWNSSPEFRGEVSISEWTSDLKRNDNAIYIDFSTFFQDDFNTSIALAQQVGSRIVTTNIGGREDLRGEVSILDYQYYWCNDPVFVEKNSRVYGELLFKSIENFGYKQVEKEFSNFDYTFTETQLKTMSEDVSIAFSLKEFAKSKQRYIDYFSGNSHSIKVDGLYIYSSVDPEVISDQLMNYLYVPEYRITYLSNKIYNNVAKIKLADQLDPNVKMYISIMSKKSNVELI